MMVRCAWCDEHLGLKEGPEGQVSYGICLACGVEHFPEQYEDYYWASRERCLRRGAWLLVACGCFTICGLLLVVLWAW